MKILEQIKIWWINRQKRKIIKLIVANHVQSPFNKSRAKDLEKGIYKSVKIVVNTIAEAEAQRKEQFDEKLISSLQDVIKKHYADKEEIYTKKDMKIINLQQTIEKKTKLLENIQ